MERLRKVDLARTEFVGVAVHELRTPLAAILGVLSTLKEHGAVLEDHLREELIDGAETQAERLTRLVEDLLTVSRIEDGVLRPSMEPVDLRDLIADAGRASGTADRLGLELDAPERVVCDADAVGCAGDGARPVHLARAGAHGGELEVGDGPKDAPEGGTRFTFWLPVVDPGGREVRVDPSEATSAVGAAIGSSSM